MGHKLLKVGCYLSIAYTNDTLYDNYNYYYMHHLAGPYTNALDLYLFPSMSHRHSAHLQRQSNKELPLERIWKTVESVWSDTVSAEVARSRHVSLYPNPHPQPTSSINNYNLDLYLSPNARSFVLAYGICQKVSQGYTRSPAISEPH
jgi:hypothetical protein